MSDVGTPEEPETVEVVDDPVTFGDDDPDDTVDVEADDAEAETETEDGE